jgi:ABC-type multidrug transport system ATPase subunit
MIFCVLSSGKFPTGEHRDTAYLTRDNWDDWKKYETQFSLIVFDSEGNRHEPGKVKIGQRGLKEAPASEDIQPGEKRIPLLEQTFEALDERYISLGQDENYYEVLRGLPGDLGIKIFQDLRDAAFNTALLDSFATEPVVGESLMRFVSREALRNRLHQIARGNPALTKFHFAYRLPKRSQYGEPVELSFSVEPGSLPPTNIHVLIGRNGVGKTQFLKVFTKAILGTEKKEGEDLGEITFGKTPLFTPENPLEAPRLSGLVAVSFSAFDGFELPEEQEIRSGMRANLVGYESDRQSTGAKTEEAKPGSAFTQVFCRSLEACRKGPRRDRLKAALEVLSSDPLFAEAAPADLLDASDADWEKKAAELFGNLSSGHSIILLTITRLVELVDEKTLVLLDEPEGHLHPPLLSAFVRALSQLLSQRNGVAVISTHSPVILQEVPKSCVWKMNRAGNIVTADRPAIETFGENVGTLTREIFRLEVTSSGFHNLLDREVEQEPHRDYKTILDDFDDQLGLEARCILRSLIAIRDGNQNGGIG